MKALILAGGKGTRLSEITQNQIPKPMAKIAGKMILEWAIKRLKEEGIHDIVISVGHMAEKIINHFEDGKAYGVNIEYIKEQFPLGSGGALYYLKDMVEGDCLVCSGDTIFDIDIKRMLKYHRKKRAIATLLTHPNIHPYDSDLIVVNRHNRVLGIDKKDSVRDYYYHNNVNAGFFIFNKKALEHLKEPANINMEHDFIASLIEDEEKVYAYRSSEFIKDVGTVERFRKVEQELLDNLVVEKKLSNAQKAIFLDRDGTINVYKGFITKKEEIELLPGVSEAIKKINQSGYLAIVVSNQPVIARGEATFKEVEDMFAKIETLLGKEGAYLDGYYYCPHHPQKGFKGEIKRLKKVCDCRKPNIGLLLKAQKDFNIDLDKSWMIGDSTLDRKLAENAHMPVILVETGAQNSEEKYQAKDLEMAVNVILKEERV